MSEFICICCRVSPANRLPIHLAGRMNSGTRTSEAKVICQERANIVTRTITRLMRFPSTPDSVDVNACCAPMTSLFSRDTSAPVCVRVKNATGWRCTCANTSVRRSKIRPSPMRADCHLLISPTIASTIASSATSRALTVTTAALPGVMPSSTMRRNSRG